MVGTRPAVAAYRACEHAIGELGELCRDVRDEPVDGGFDGVQRGLLGGQPVWTVARDEDAEMGIDWWRLLHFPVPCASVAA